MPYLYVMFSHTNTGIGKLIRSVTKSEYNHVSLLCAILLPAATVTMRWLGDLWKKPQVAFVTGEILS